MPRKRCFSAKRKCSKSAPASLRCICNNRPKKRKGWMEESMTTAIKAVQEGRSLSQAARDHGVPNTTLYDQVSGRVMHGTTLAPNLTKRKRSLAHTGSTVQGLGMVRREEMFYPLLRLRPWRKVYCDRVDYHRDGGVDSGICHFVKETQQHTCAWRP